MLDGLFVTPAVTAIAEALTSAAATEGPIVVVGNAKLATALSAKREVIAVGMTARAARKFELAAKRRTDPKGTGDRQAGPRECPPEANKLANVQVDTTAIAAGSCAAVIGVDVTEDAQWSATLAAWSRVVRDGGALVLVDKGHAAEASRRALCAGLTELEQRHAGRAVITSGLVSHLE